MGDARLYNIARMRGAGIHEPMLLLRSPAPSEIFRCIDLADISLNSDLGVLNALSKESLGVDKRHRVILMVDLDTGREGFAPEAMSDVCREVRAMDGLTLEGLGIYFPYRSEGNFHMEAQQRLVALAKEIEQESGIALSIVSGGSTNVFHNLTLEGKSMGGVNQLRIGTAILLGISSSIGPRHIEGFYNDTFVLDAELIEFKKRDRLLGILSLGQLDTEPEYLFPLSPGVTVVESSRDHVIVDLTESPQPPRVGDRISFQLGYFALSRLTVSPYVKIEYC
ncbi:MAG: alanine racemase [Thermodesulfobacteriota bacterium]|nr:alanine racemase [Thermodesulfobacteriota bacterium]